MNHLKKINNTGLTPLWDIERMSKIVRHLFLLIALMLSWSAYSDDGTIEAKVSNEANKDLRDKNSFFYKVYDSTQNYVWK